MRATVQDVYAVYKTRVISQNSRRKASAEDERSNVLYCMYSTLQSAGNGPRWRRFNTPKINESQQTGAVLTLQKSSHYCASEPKRCQEIGAELYELTSHLLTLVCMCFMEMKREFAQSDTYLLPFFG